MKIEALTAGQLEQAKALLRKNNLPVQDLDVHTHLFGTYEGEVLVGVAGLELLGESALVRSVCVAETYRSKGMAELLTEHIEKFATKNGAHTLYLLTTTAENYFKRKGYIKIDRNSVPQNINDTTEFSSVCPSSATAMKKVLT